MGELLGAVDSNLDGAFGVNHASFDGSAKRRVKMEFRLLEGVLGIGM
jgi:hypothetical protein